MDWVEDYIVHREDFRLTLGCLLPMTTERIVVGSFFIFDEAIVSKLVLKPF